MTLDQGLYLRICAHLRCLATFGWGDPDGTFGGPSAGDVEALWQVVRVFTDRRLHCHRTVAPGACHYRLSAAAAGRRSVCGLAGRAAGAELSPGVFGGVYRGCVGSVDVADPCPRLKHAIYADYVGFRGGCDRLHDFDQPLDGVPATRATQSI